ncbi:hypothetical protein [Halorubrum distributum]|uniref:DUF1102 domain-containing protein n=1 Tax=Halorubrum distributum JCM 13916 TaxID=1230455 RepID=M0PIB1_9EURY|nr:hypothetical protein [Halorubrum arcis]EMA69653.1 hypothetical protein C462_12295 [Halorubrum arcis JCM 13916]
MERRKFVVGLGALASGSAAAVGTGAFSAAQISGREADIAVSSDADALIQLIPGYDAVGQSDSTVTDNRVGYENGQLFISFDDSGTGGNGSGNGVNPNSVYQVGAIGDDGQDDLANYVDGVAPGPAVSDDILYGDATGANSGSGKLITDDPAFVIRNESDQDYEMTLSVDNMSTPDTSSFTAAIVLRNGQQEGAFSAAQSLGDDPEGFTNFTLTSGEEVAASLIVVTGDLDPSSEDDFSGSLHLNAGGAVQPPNQP